MLGNTANIFEVVMKNAEQNIDRSMEGNEQSLQNTPLNIIKEMETPRKCG